MNINRTDFISTSPYDKGYEDGYNDVPNNNPFDEILEYMRWVEYEDGYEEGSRNC